ncbi:hypothetical protein IJ596_05535 [bacterium]|nr:hypothetical protein [bacterium]
MASLKSIVKKIRTMNSQNTYFGATSPIEDLHDKQRKIFLRGMSKYALDLYVRKKDIKSFTKIAMSNPEDNSQEDIVDSLIKSGKVSDIISGSAVDRLSSNKKLLDDLGF